MKYKSFCSALAGIGLLFASTGAMAQDKKVRMQVASAFPGGLVLLGPAGHHLVDKMRKLSGGSIDARFFEPGALVPASQYLDAIANNSLDSAYSAAGFFTGKEIAFALYNTVPFGPEISEYLGWFRHGGGQKLMDELMAKYKTKVVLCGIVPPEASGWFRKEIGSVQELNGLKMRFFGLGANVMQKLGVATQLLQAGEIFQALQLGTIDATEYSAPALDISLGFHQVAKHYYFPGWHQMASITHYMMSLEKWSSLSPTQQEIVNVSCDSTMMHMLAEGEAIQPAALKDLQAKGVTVHSWSKPVLDALRKAWDEVVAEQSLKSPEFKKGWDSLAAYRKNYKIWKDVAYMKE